MSGPDTAEGRMQATDLLLSDSKTVETVLGLANVRTRDLVLPPALHKAYLDHTWHSRRKINAGWMIWAAALNAFCCALAFLIVPAEALETVVGGRIAISVVLVGGAGAIFAMRRSGAEGLVTIAVCLGVIGIAGGIAANVRDIGSASGHHLAERYIVHAIFMCGTAIVVARIAWTETLALTIAILLALAALLVTPATADMTTAEKIQMAAFFGVGLIGLALAKRAMKKLHYRVFILGLVDRLKMAEIEEMNGRLHAIARTDALTAVSNRRGFDEAFGALQTRTDQSSPVALFMIDIDFFKRLNDARGHAAGDECLRIVAGVISAELRHGQDLLARFGGEEFVAIVPHVDAGEAVAIAERVRSAVEARGIANPGSESGLLTVSVGVAVSPPASVERLVARADAALYEAKSGGRNAVKLAPAPAALRVA